MNGSERVNTALSGSGRVDDIKSHPQGDIRGQTNLVKPEMRRKLAQLPFEEKIRKVGELIRLRQKIKTAGSNGSEEAALVASLDKAAAELDAGKGVPLERVRENMNGRHRRGNRRNDGPHFLVSPTCHVVALAKMGARRRRKQGIGDNEALEKRLKDKAEEFTKKGAELYARA